MQYQSEKEAPQVTSKAPVRLVSFWQSLSFSSQDPATNAASLELKEIKKLNHLESTLALSQLASSRKMDFVVSDTWQVGDELLTLVVNEKGLMVQVMAENDPRDFDILFESRKWLRPVEKIRDFILDLRYGDSYHSPLLEDVLEGQLSYQAVSQQIEKTYNHFLHPAA